VVGKPKGAPWAREWPTATYRVIGKVFGSSPTPLAHGMGGSYHWRGDFSTLTRRLVRATALVRHRRPVLALRSCMISASPRRIPLCLTRRSRCGPLTKTAAAPPTPSWRIRRPFPLATAAAPPAKPARPPTGPVLYLSNHAFRCSIARGSVGESAMGRGLPGFEPARRVSRRPSTDVARRLRRPAQCRCWMFSVTCVARGAAGGRRFGGLWPSSCTCAVLPLAPRSLRELPQRPIRL